MEVDQECADLNLTVNAVDPALISNATDQQLLTSVLANPALRRFKIKLF